MMFCTGENEILLYNQIIEKHPYLDDFKKHYIDLCCWCYINQRDDFFRIINESETMKNDFNDLRDCFTDTPKVTL